MYVCIIIYMCVYLYIIIYYSIKSHQYSAWIVFKCVKQKHLDKTIIHQQIVTFVTQKSKPTLYQIVIYMYMCRNNPLGHDCSWLTSNLAVRLLYLCFCITNQTICSFKYNFVQTIGRYRYEMSKKGLLLDIILSAVSNINT